MPEPSTPPKTFKSPPHTPNLISRPLPPAAMASTPPPSSSLASLPSTPLLSSAANPTDAPYPSPTFAPRTSSSASIRDVHVDITQTPNRLHHQFRQFARTQADQQISPLTLPSLGDSPLQPLPSSQTWAPRSSVSPASARRRRFGSLPHDSASTGAALAASGDLHLFLDFLRSQRQPADDSRHRSRLVANFQSLTQEAALVLQQRELMSRTAHPTLTVAEMKVHEATVLGLTDNSHLAVNARSVVTDIHRLSFDDLQRHLRTDLKLGLHQAEVLQRQTEHGLNLLTPAPSPSMGLLLLRELFTGFGPILWVAALLSFLAWKPFGDPPDPMNIGLAVVIIAVIVLSSFFAFYQTRKSIGTITAFSRILPSFAMVRIEGREQPMLASQLVPGDVVHIKLGDEVPADVRLLSCDSLQVNNSALTGESEPVNCTVEASSDNILGRPTVALYSSLVISGAATAVVLNTGDRTVLGTVSTLTKGDSDQRTNLQNEIRRFVYLICSLAVGTAILCFLIWFLWLRTDFPSFLTTSQFLTNVIGLVVAYLPTGLPLSLSLVLTFVARHMYQQHILVKNLSIVEDYNSVSLILSDKTGTLTMNQLTAVSLIWGAAGRLTVPPTVEGGDAPFLQSAEFNNPVVQSALQCALLCNGVELTESMGGLQYEQQVTGDAVDVALYYLSLKCRLQLEDIRKASPRMRVLPFNSRQKFMVSVHQRSAQDKEQLLAIIKGAPESVLRNCTHWADDSGAVEDLTEDRRTSIAALQDQMGGNGYRVIALSRRYCTLTQLNAEQSDLGVPQTSYTFVGLFCFIDPPREGVPAAVVKSHGAGIRVAMVTGNHPSTAVAIAKQVNILLPYLRMDTCHVQTDAAGRWTVDIHRDGQLLDSHTIGAVVDSNAHPSPANRVRGSLAELFEAQVPECKKRQVAGGAAGVSAFSGSQWVNDGSTKDCGILVTGGDLRAFDVAMWDFCLSHHSMVFARTSPEQKLKIVSECQKRGEIVAVTGDGVNDAPAMKRADVGVAMEAGTEVAQEAADMILLDNNFVSVVTAIETGRLVSDNLKKVTLYLLPAGSWSELLPILANFFLGLPLPLSAFLMVVICCLTDLCPSLALVQESAESDIMKRAPVKRKESHLVDWRLIFHAYALVGMIESICAFLCWFWYFHEEGVPASALFFAFDSYADGFQGKSQAELDELLFTGQSIFFVALVVMQFFSLLSTRTCYVSLFSHSPFSGPSRNLWLFAAMTVSSLIAIVITQVGFLNDTFHTRPVPVRFVMPALGFGALLLLFDETRKAVRQRYPKSLVAWMAW